MCRKPWRRIRSWCAQEAEVEVFLMIAKFFDGSSLSTLTPCLFALFLLTVVPKRIDTAKKVEKKAAGGADSSSSNIPLCGRYYWWKCKLDFQIYFPVCCANRQRKVGRKKGSQGAKDSLGDSSLLLRIYGKLSRTGEKCCIYHWVLVRASKILSGLMY